jgi:hypothetical protein
VKTTKHLVLAVILIVGLTGVAYAHPHPPPNPEVSTRLTLSANKSTVRANTPVTFSGQLSASKSKCYKNLPVSIYRNGVLVGSATTGSTGRFSVVLTVSSTATYTAKFDGAIVGLHPDVKICGASVSRGVKITICRSHLGYRPGSAARTGCH